MRRFRSLLSGVSVVAVLAAFGAADPALAAQTISGPATSPPVTNTQPDSVTINLDATIDQDEDGISFFNGKSMTDAGANLTVNDSYLLGDISNTAAMTSGANAIDILNDSQIGGAIFNSSVITATAAGISIVGDSTVAEGIENTGSIVGATGIFLGDDSEIFGGLTNSGLISGAFGVNVAEADAELRGGIHNEQGGSIVGTGTAAIEFDGAFLTGGITNNGLIRGATGADGIVLNTGSITGGISNNEAGVIEVTDTGVTAIVVNGPTFVGNITNSGQILAEATNSVALSITGATVFTGNVVNLAGGVISASAVAVSISNTAGFTGNLSNSGSIESLAADAVAISATTFTGDVINEEDAVIIGADNGVNLTGTTFAGDLTNHGTITGAAADGIFVSATAFNGDVINDGLINAPLGDGLVVDAGTVLTGDIFNNEGGEITAGAVGIRIDGTVTGAIANGGVIDPTTGILVNGQVNGGITNTGTILGDLNAISLAPADAATTITQTDGLIRGNNGAVTTALRLDQTGAEFVDTFNGDGGVLDGDIVGGGTDDVVMGPASGDTFAYLRGTAAGLDEFDMDGAGTALLGANLRGAVGATNAPGVTVGAVSMTMGGEGRLYMDDDTVVTLSGAYTQTDGTLEFQLTSDTTAGTYGTIAATGGANLGGNIAAYIQGDTFASVGGNTFTYQDVITGATAGTFANAGTIETNSLFFEGEAVVNANDVDIVLQRLSFMDALVLPGLTQNQQAVAGALDAIYDGGAFGSDFEDLFNYLLSLPAGSEHEVEHIYDELAGAEHADLQDIGLRASEAFVNAIDDRFDDMKGAGHASMASLGLRRYAEAAPTVANDASMSPQGLRGSMGVSVWGRGYGAWTEADGDEEAEGYDQDTGGFAGGLDFAVNESWKVGGAIGWSSTSVEFATVGDEADIDGFQFAAYAAYERGHFYADALIGAGFHDISSTRLLDLGFTTEVATADYDANSFAAKGEIGAIFDAGRIDVLPFVGLGYVASSTDGFAESGAGDFGLLVGDADADSLASTVGLRLSGNWTAGRVRLIPEVEVAWRHEFMDQRQTFSAAFLDDPATQFQIVSSELSRESVLASAGMGVQVTKGLVLFLDYSGSFNSAANTHAGSAGLRATW